MKTPKLAVLLLIGVSALSPLVHADPCEGDKLESQAVSAGPDEIGRLELYYDRAEGKHCAAMKHTGLTEKKPGFTRVSVAACKDRSCSAVVAPVLFDADSAYVEEAGPLRLAARGKCVIANGMIAYKGETYSVRGTPHCG